MPGVPIPDQDSQTFLDNARAQAADSLRGKVPDAMLQPITTQPSGSFTQTAVSHGPAPSAEPPQDPTESAAPLTSEDGEMPGPGPDAKPPAEKTIGDRAWALTKGALGQSNRALELIEMAGATPAMLADKIHSAATGKDSHELQDWYFNHTIDNTVANQSDFELDDKADLTDKILHGVGSTLMLIDQAIASGGRSAAVESAFARTLPQKLAVGAVTMSAPAAIEAVDKGRQLLQATGDGDIAAKGAATAYIANVLAGLVPFGVGKRLITKIVTAGLTSGAVSEGQRVVQNAALGPETTDYQRRLMSDQDRQKANAVMAQRQGFDPQDLLVSIVTGAPLGAIHPIQHYIGEKVEQYKQARKNSQGGPAPSAQPPDLLATPPGQAGQEPPPPGPPPGPAPSAEPPAAPTPAPTVNSVPAVPDVPSPEPLSDLKAQKADAQDPATPRKGVYLSKDAKAALTPEQLTDLKSGMVQIPNFDKKGGLMLVPDSATAKDARALRAAEPDMQKVLGQLTGAGDGKAPEQTAVVQGQTPEGAVAKEQMVTPQEVPAAVQATSQEGKTPVVTTPVEAQQRRAEVVASEQAPAATPEPVKTPAPEPSKAAEAPEPEAKFAKGQRKLVAVAGEKVPVVVDGPSVNGKVPVRMVDEDGRVAREVRQVPEHMFGETPEAPAAAAAQEAPASEPKPAEEAPKAAESAAAAAWERVASTAQLSHATELFTQQNTPEPGKKFAGTVKEHAQRVAELARAVISAAKDTSLPDAVRKHAVEAARRVSKMDQKSDEAIAKNQGVGHRMLDAYGEDLVRAAHNIMDPAKAVIPETPVNVKAAALKARREKANAADTPKPTEPAPASEAPKARELKAKEAAKKGDGGRAADAASGKVQTAIKDIPDARKPRAAQLTQREQRDIQGAARRYVTADDHEAPAMHDLLEKTLHEIYGDDRAHEVQNMLQLIREQRDAMREDAYTPKRMSETVDEDELRGSAMDRGDRGRLQAGHDEEEGPVENEAEGPKGLITAATDGDSSISRHAEWAGFHQALINSKFWDSILTNRGQGMSSYKMLDHMLKIATPGSAIHDLIQKLRDNGTDVTITAVPAVKDRFGVESNARGMHTYDPRTNKDSIQLRANPEEIRTDPRFTRTILHELVHAATVRFMRAHPDHPLTLEATRLLTIARERADAMIEAAGKNRLQNYSPDAGHGFPLFSSDDAGAPRKVDWDRQATGSFYGLKNVYELLAEVGVNPDHQAMLASSSKYARAFEGLRDIVTSIGRKIAAMIGIKDPRTTQLLHNILDVRDRIIESQRFERENGHIPPEHTVHDLESLDEPAPPLPHDDEFRSAVGDHATQVTSMFRRAVRSGALETIRQNVRGLITYSQLIRTSLRRMEFGPNDAMNPLRQYHETMMDRDSLVNQHAHEIANIVNDRQKLGFTDDDKLGDFQRDAQLYGISPELDKTLHPASVTGDPKFENRWTDFQNRWKALSDAQRDIYRRERDMNDRLFRAGRKAAVNAALEVFSDKEVPQATRRLLYSVDNHADFKSLIGPKGIVDVGERNEALTRSLEHFAATYGREGDYFHLGRHGNWVAEVKPEGTRTFATEAAARAFGARIEELSPKSKATVEMVGGQWQVDYKAHYVSMHESPAAADKEVERLRALGYDVGSPTVKILSDADTASTAGLHSLIEAANRKLAARDMESDTREQLHTALRQGLSEILAQRSANAASKLTRQNVGGVKGAEMGRNFAEHAQSMAYHVGNLTTMFKAADALGRLRDAVKDSDQPAARAAARGRTYNELRLRLAQESRQFGTHTPMNSFVAKAGFLNYITSFAHVMTVLTQNFSTAIPIAMTRHGKLRALDSFRASMGLISSPALRETFRALALKGDADSMLKAVYAAVAKDKRFGKWAQGDNSPLQQLIDRGAIHTSLSNQLAQAAKGGSKVSNRVFEYARLLPSVADLFNRVSTGLSALELHKGDVYRAADFVRETHMDYSQSEKPRAFRAVNKVWGGNSVTMFRTYLQGMAHLLYSHVYDSALETEGGRTQALTTVAGLLLGATLFAGVQRGMGLEPVRAFAWAYHKIAGDNNEYYSFDNMSKRFVSQVVGENKIADMINGGLPRAFGFDLSSHLGLSDLLFHDPPDISSLDSSAWGRIAAGLLGPAFQETADMYHAASNAIATGRVSDWMKLLPIKAVQNVINAYTVATEGATNARGIHLTEPSYGGAAWAALGVKTAEQANTQEKMNTDSEYRNWAGDRKRAFIDRYMKADPADRGEIWNQAQQFSNVNPEFRVTRGDLIKAQRGFQRSQMEAEGEGSRDPVENELNDY